MNKPEINKTVSSFVLLALICTMTISSLSVLPVGANGSGKGPTMNNLQFTFYSDQTSMFNALISNQIDFMGWPLSQNEYNTVSNNQNSNIQLLPSYNLDVYDIAFNNNATDPSHADWGTSPTELVGFRKAMNYTEFRQAMACLVDKDKLVSSLNGFATRIDTPIPRPAMDNWVNFQDSKYDSNGNLQPNSNTLSGNNYPWDYSETNALTILWNNGWYSQSTYPALTNLLAAFQTNGQLPMGSVVYPDGPKAGQPIDSIVAYIRTDDPARQQAGDALANEMEKIGISVTRNYVNGLSAARTPVYEDHDYDFYTEGYLIGSMPTWFYSSYTPAGIYPNGPNICMIQDADLTYHATLENNAPTLTDYMNEALICQDIITQQAMFVPLYSTISYYAYRTGWLNAVATKVLGLQASEAYYSSTLDYFMLAVQNQNPTVNTIRFGTLNSLDAMQINPLFSSDIEDYQVIDRIFTGVMNTNPFSPTTPGDMPWMVYDATSQLSNFWGWNPYNGPGASGVPGTDVYGAADTTYYTNCANCTYYFRDDIKWQDGTPFTVDDFNYTLYLNNVYGDAYSNIETGYIVNFTKINDYTCSIYFNSPSFTMLYDPIMDIVPEHIYSLIDVPAGAQGGATTTGLHGDWPGQDALPGEVNSSLTYPITPEQVLVGTGMWRYDPNTYVSGGGITLDANRGFFIYTPATISGGSASIDETSSTGVSVAVNDPSAADGTPVFITTNEFTGTPPGTAQVALTPAAYYDINIQGISGGTATVCITNSDVTGQTIMKYWDGAQWEDANNIMVSGDTVCGDIPVSALTGTPVAIGPPSVGFAQLTVVSAYGTPTPASGPYTPGTTIVASVTPVVAGPAGTQYVCIGWTGTGDVPATGTTTSVTFTITQNSSITWNWEAQSTNYTLTVNVVGNGSVTVNPLELSYLSGTNVTLTATPGSMWTFWNWSGDVSGTVIWHDQYGDIMLNQTSIIMDGNKTVTATFGLLGDLNRDGQVNLQDLTIFAWSWRSRPGDLNWNPLCDMAAPYGSISLSDLITLALNYGKHT